MAPTLDLPTSRVALPQIVYRMLCNHPEHLCPILRLPRRRDVAPVDELDDRIRVVRGNPHLPRDTQEKLAVALGSKACQDGETGEAREGHERVGRASRREVDLERFKWGTSRRSGK